MTDLERFYTKYCGYGDFKAPEPPKGKFIELVYNREIYAFDNNGGLMNVSICDE